MPPIFPFLNNLRLNVRKTVSRLSSERMRLGRRGENLAALLLQSKGYDILARNWRSKAGELDIVARDGARLVFVEVKTRRRFSALYRPGDNLSYRQMTRNFHAAKLFVRKLGLVAYGARFDLIEVTAPRLRRYSIIHTPDIMPGWSAGAFLRSQEREY